MSSVSYDPHAPAVRRHLERAEGRPGPRMVRPVSANSTGAHRWPLRALVILGTVALAFLARPSVGVAQTCTTFVPPCPANEPPSISIFPRSGNVTSASPTLSVQLIDDQGLNQGSFNSSGGAFTVTWSSGGTEGYGQGGPSPALLPNVSTRITVWVSDIHGAQARDSVDLVYVPPPPPPAQGKPLLSLAPHNGGARGGAAFGGDAVLAYATPTYTSLDVARAVTLTYSSARAAPRGFVQLEASDNSTTNPDRMSLRLIRQTNGQVATLLSGGTEVFYQAGDGSFRLGAAFAADTMATGAYDYLARVKNWWGADSLADTVTARVLVVNEQASPFGWGWSLAGLQQLHFGRADGAVVVTGGDGSIAFFANPGCSAGATCSFTTPAGDFTALKYDASSGKYTRRTQDSTVFTFWGSGSNLGRLEKVVNRFGDSTKFTYSAGLVTQLTDPAGKSFVLEYGVQGSYGASGKLARIVDPGGRETKFAYDLAANLIKIVDPDGVIALEAIYDGQHRVTASWGRTLACSDVVYDAHGTVDSTQAPTITTTDAGLFRPTTVLRSLERAVLPASGKGSSSVPADAVRPDSAYVRVRSPRGSITKTWLHATGAPLKVVDRDASGTDIVTSWERNPDGLPTVVVSPKNSRTTYDWSPTGGQLLKVTDFATGMETRYEYHTTSNQVEKVFLNEVLKVRNFYDSAGRLDSTKVDTSMSRFTNDARGRVLTAKDPDGHEQRFTYLSSGFQNTDWTAVVHGGVERRTTFGYDAFGRRTSATDHSGRVFSTVFDSLNRARSTSAPDTMNVQYAFDDAARVSTVTDPTGQVYRDSLNALGWLIKRTDPRGLSELFEYDRNGNLTIYTNRRGAKVRSTFDTLDRVLTRVADSVGGAAKDSAAFAYDPAKKWVTVANGESVDTLRFDSDDRPSELFSQRGADRRFVVQSSYNDDGQRSWLRVWRSKITGYQGETPIWITAADSMAFGYDNALRENYIARVESGTHKGTEIGYNRDGLPKSVKVPTGSSPSQRLALTYTYAPSHAIDTLGVGMGLDVQLGRRYANDVHDRISTMRQGASGFEKVRRLEYTTLGRLKNYTDEQLSETYEQICPDPFDLNSCYTQTTVHTDTLRREVYTYDKVGNRKDHAAVIQTGNWVTSFDGYTLTYDNDGNMVSKSKSGVWSQTFTWNALGQLVKVVTNGVTTTFGYDGWGRRVRKTVNGVRTQFVHDGDHVIAEIDSALTVLRAYAYYPGVDRPHSVRTGGQTYHYLTEQPGHVTGLVNASNQLVNRYEYTPFGEAITTQEQVIQPLRFGAREYDSDNKLYFNRARYYAPQVGRFISEDPIRLDGGINTFTYAANDPINGGDPFGLDCRNITAPVYNDSRDTPSGSIGMRICSGDPRGVLGQIRDAVLSSGVFGNSSWAAYDFIPGAIYRGATSLFLPSAGQPPLIAEIDIQSRRLIGCPNATFSWSRNDAELSGDARIQRVEIHYGNPVDNPTFWRDVFGYVDYVGYAMVKLSPIQYVAVPGVARIMCDDRNPGVAPGSGKFWGITWIP